MNFDSCDDEELNMDQNKIGGDEESQKSKKDMRIMCRIPITLSEAQ